MFIALTPTVGIQMLLVMILASVTRPFFISIMMQEYHKMGLL
jgi:hypothetical protein